MLSLQNSLTKLNSLTVFVSALCAGFLFVTGSHIPKYILLLLCLFLIVQKILNKQFSSSYVQGYFSFTSPWIPWFVSFIVLILFFGGVPRDIEFFNAFLIMSVIFIAIYPNTPSRQFVIKSLSLSLLIACLAVCIQVVTYGFDGGSVIGSNKNKVLGITSVLTACCVGSLLMEGQLYNKQEKILIIVSTIVSLTSIIVAEVRTAILPFLALIPFVLIYRKENRFRNAGIFLLIALVLLFLSFMTGRMQQGLSDLQQYSSGNSYSSWGIRIELWKLALTAFWDAPFFGWGSEPYENMVQAGYTFCVSNFHPEHFHCDFLNALTIGGLFEIFCWLATIIILVIKSWKDPAKMCLLVALMAVCLTDRYWFYRTTLFAFVTAWTLLFLSHPKQQSLLEND